MYMNLIRTKELLIDALLKCPYTQNILQIRLHFISTIIQSFTALGQLPDYSMCKHIEGSRPEWCISNMIYSRDIPFWYGTLHIVSYDYWTDNRQELIPFSLIISRVSDQNGVSLLYIMLEIHHSGREPSICYPRHNTTIACELYSFIS